MIAEGKILLAVERLQQRGGRVAAIIRAHLVNLVEQDKRIRAAGLLHCVDNTARHRAYVGFAVPADFRFVMHAAERNTGIAAAHCLGNGARNGGFPHAGRANQADDLPLNIR